MPYALTRVSGYSALCAAPRDPLRGLRSFRQLTSKPAALVYVKVVILCEDLGLSDLQKLSDETEYRWVVILCEDLGLSDQRIVRQREGYLMYGRDPLRGFRSFRPTKELLPHECHQKVVILCEDLGLSDKPVNCVHRMG